MSARASRRLPDLETALPLLAAYFGLAALYAWQAWQRQTVTLFSDEIEFTQISRAVAETGRAALRGGEPAPGASLYAYLAAPAWWLDRVDAAFGAIKLLGVLLMTATIFPAYGLARFVVARPYALFAAVATAAAPALSYAPFLVEEPMAYPVSTLALYLTARAAIRPTRWSVGLMLGACVLGVLVRSQLAVLLPVVATVFAARAWRGDRMRGWTATWSRGDRVGTGVLVVGLLLGISAALGHRSVTWYTSTAFFKDRMLEYGLWAAGALAIGVGVLPFIGGLAALVRPHDEEPEERVRTFVALSIAAIAAFGFYTAVKVAYISTQLSIVIAERNLMYLYPLLFAGTALVLQRRRASPLAIGAATLFALYLVKETPYSLESYPNYEAHGLAIAAFGNRILKWPAETIETTLVLVTVGSAMALLALGWIRVRLLGGIAAAGLGAFVVAWGLTAEIYAANGERIASEQIYANLPKPPDWIERTTGGEPTIFVGQGIDAFAAWQVEFWNPAVRWFWGMDGSAPGPGERRTPNLLRPDGTQDPADLNAQYAVSVNGVEVAAPVVTTAGGAVLYRLGGKPVRLVQTTSGIAPDGWIVKEASFTRYAAAGRSGYVTVRFSRTGACAPDKLKPVTVTARVGPVIVDAKDQPAIGRVTDRASGTLAPCLVEGLLLRVPSRPWRVEVTVSDTFVPQEIDSNSGDRRELGAVVSFEISARDTSPEG